MIAVTLPDWLDTDNLRNVALLAIVSVVVVAYFVTKIITAIIVRTAMLAVLAAIGLFFWSQRVELGACADDARRGDCECVIVGFTIPLPDRVQEICDARAASVG